MNTLRKEFYNTMIFLKGHYIKYFIGIVGMTFARSTCALLESYLLKTFLDVGAPDSILTIFKMLAWLIFYVILIMLLLPIFQFFFNGQAKYGHGNINKAIYNKYGQLPISYFEKKHSGEIMSVFLNDSWVLSAIFMRHFRRVATSVITIIIYLIPMFVLDYRITFIMLVLNLLTLIVNVKVSSRLKTAMKQIQKRMEAMTVTISNMISGMTVIRIYQLTTVMRKRFQNDNDDISKMTMEMGKMSSGLSAYNFAIYIVNIVVFLFLGSLMVEHKLTTYGNIISIMSLQTALDLNFREFGDYYPRFFNGLAATERVYDFFKETEEPESYCKDMDAASAEEHATNPYIEFKNVSFSYDCNNMVIKDFSMSISKGESIALVGESGCGKSSIVKLLLGFYPVDEGVICIDGHNLGNANLSELRNLIAYVPQDATMFNTTIWENIRYGNPHATDCQIINAAKSANAYNFIMEQPDGFQTLIGEQGTKLSGGQCQRIAIARAILKDAPILLLDEATSALDNVSEQLIIEALQNYSKTRTTISIAHRPSSIKYADRVIRVG